MVLGGGKADTGGRHGAGRESHGATAREAGVPGPRGTGRDDGASAADARTAPRFAPLRVPAFRRFVLASLVSATGSAMAPLALAYAVIGQGGTGSLGVVLATNSLPTIVPTVVCGVLADRLSRSRILFLGNLLAAIQPRASLSATCPLAVAIRERGRVRSVLSH